MAANEANLEFFTSLSGRLRIELDKPAAPITPELMNLAAPADAKIKSVRLELTVFLRDQSEFRPLTDEESARVVLVEPEIKLTGESDAVITCPAPNGTSFTVRDLADAIATMERESRGGSEWFGGVDVHHVFFEGMELEEDGVWHVHWGS
jgi:hypothetical protein